MIIYTAIIGGYDKLNEYTTNCRKLCFTDNASLRSTTWEVVKVRPLMKIHRKIKILPHLFLPPHERSIWIDGNIKPTMDIEKFAEDKSGFWVMQHPVRNCIYQEAAACIALRKDNPRTITRQISKYRAEGYPEHNGMVSTGVLIRDNVYQEFLNSWWKEVYEHSVRDQLSFNYAATKHNLKFQTFPFLYGLQKDRHIKNKYR